MSESFTETLWLVPAICYGSVVSRHDTFLCKEPCAPARYSAVFCGEYPAHSLHLLGKEQVMKELVHRLTTAQTFRNDETGEEHTCRLLTITGRGREKSIRFYKAGLAILGWVHPDAYGYYMRSF